MDTLVYGKWVSSCQNYLLPLSEERGSKALSLPLSDWVAFQGMEP